MTEMKWNTNYGDYVYRVPEGLRELCSDISREVLRTQPKNIYCFIADYVDARLARQDMAKVAVEIVSKVLRDSELIVNALNCMGFEFKQIAAAAPKLQNAFRLYLDDIDLQSSENTNNDSCDLTSEVFVRDILKTTGMLPTDAENTQQPDEYVEMQTCILNSQQQTATVNTIEILCKADVASKRGLGKCSLRSNRRN